jgi:hypothetical protein
MYDYILIGCSENSDIAKKFSKFSNNIIIFETCSRILFDGSKCIGIEYNTSFIILGKEIILCSLYN